MGKKALYIYSGKCCLGKCGEETPLKTVDGEVLCIGDIVSIQHVSSLSNHGLTAIVNDKWTTFNNNTHKLKDGTVQAFVMGIKNDSIKLDSNECEWYVNKVKSYKEVIDGEHWSEYGFNYRLMDIDTFSKDVPDVKHVLGSFEVEESKFTITGAVQGFFDDTGIVQRMTKVDE